MYLSEEETVTSQLNRLASQENSEWSFINAGIGGSSTSDYLAFLQEFEAILPPFHALIVHLNVYDISRNLSKNLFVLQPETNTLTRSHRWRPTPIYDAIRYDPLHAELEMHSRIYAVISRVLWKHMFFEDAIEHNPTLPTPDTDDWSTYATEHQRAQFLAMQAWAKKRSIPFYVITTGFPIKASDKMDEAFSQIAASLTTSDGIGYATTNACLRRKASNDFESIRLVPDEHPNAIGARYMAECFKQAFEQLQAAN